MATIVESDHPDFPTGLSRLLPFAGGLSPWPFTQPLLPPLAGLENQQIAGRAVAVFYEPLRMPTRLSVWGAGDDAIPVLACAEVPGLERNRRRPAPSLSGKRTFCRRGPRLRAAGG